jgi:hypothetical protein
VDIISSLNEWETLLCNNKVWVSARASFGPHASSRPVVSGINFFTSAAGISHKGGAPAPAQGQGSFGTPFLAGAGFLIVQPDAEVGGQLLEVLLLEDPPIADPQGRLRDRAHLQGVGDPIRLDLQQAGDFFERHKGLGHL